MNFYTYMWLREDGSPYYVGKGQGNRAYRRGSPDPSRVLVQDHELESDAFIVEVFLIEFYGRKDLGTGPLINRTEGGIGGSTLDQEGRRKRSEDYKARGIKPPYRKGCTQTMTETQRHRISVGKKGRPNGRLGYKHTEETIQRMREVYRLRTTA